MAKFISAAESGYSTTIGEAAVRVDIRDGAGSAVRDVLVVGCFTATLFLSATLLFLIQPMVGKMILPTLGGTPAVWNTCMLFFQAALLAGYAYAHVTTSWLGVRRQVVLHLLVLLVPLAALPITFGGGSSPPTETNPVFWLLGSLALFVGLPFFVVSTSAPLLQKWFAASGHPSADDPFFLYAASNAGSLLALLGYPLLVQPNLSLSDQTGWWTAGYVGFIVMAVLCALAMQFGGKRRAGGETAGRRAESVRRQVPAQWPRLTVRWRLFWVAAAFVPSSLMLGVTAHITSNLAPVPLLWVIPLGLYLLTFVIVFSRTPVLPHRWMVKSLPFLVMPLAILTFLGLPNIGWVPIVVHLAPFFVATMVCHGELAQSRPGSEYLTEFYLWMSVGGVLGGIFNALVAPVAFESLVEYPLAVMLACMLLPATKSMVGAARWRWSDMIAPLAMLACVGVVILLMSRLGVADSAVTRVLFLGPIAVFCFGMKDRPIRFGLTFGVFLLAICSYSGLHQGDVLHVSRNFFGVKHVVRTADGGLVKLIHGTTNHGIQSTAAARRGEPLAYYHRTGPIGDVFDVFGGTRLTSQVGIIGLGAGAIAAYAQPGERFTFYEIDPAIERIARDPRYFTFLGESDGTCDVVLGDGRLTLGEAPDRQFGLIILDAFSSDAIPTHLLTREALQLYLDKLSPDGVLAFHISNRYLDLKPVLAALANDGGLTALARDDLKVGREESVQGKSPSQYVVMTRRSDTLVPLAGRDGWHPLRPRAGSRVWTDQHSSILSFFRWR